MKKLLSVALVGGLFAQPYKELEGHTGAVNAVAFSADSRYLLTASSDRTVRLWAVPLGTPLARYTGPVASVNALQLTGDEQGHFWAASSDGKLYLWSIAQYKASKSATPPILRPERSEPLGRRAVKYGPPPIWEGLALHPTKPLLYAVGRTGLLVGWDYQEDWLQTFQDTAGVAYAVLIPRHGKVVYLASGSGAILALDPSDLRTLRVLRGHTKGVKALALSPDQRTLASGGLDGRVMLWRVPEGLRLSTLEKHTDVVRAVAFSPDGRFLASVDKAGLLCLWNVASGRLEKTLSLEAPLWSVAFSPNGQYLVAGGQGGLLRMWRIDQLGVRPVQLIAETDSLYLPPTDVENNVPQCRAPKPYRYAFIVGNEDYKSYQPAFTPAMNVPYAVRDAYAFKMYAEQVLGVPSRNIVFLQNATSAQMRRELDKLLLLLEPTRGKAEVFFYYAGHGVPHPQTQESYLLPVDVSPNALEEGAFRLSDVAGRLGQSGAARVWMILDACFSGGARAESPLASRGIRLRPKPVTLVGPVVLIAASTADEEALPYHQAQHGLFTYFLLRALKNAACQPKPLSALLEEVSTETTRYALLLHERVQRPSWLVSPALPEEVLSQSW